MISAFDCYHGDYQISCMLIMYIHVYWLDKYIHFSHVHALSTYMSLATYTYAC